MEVKIYWAYNVSLWGKFDGFWWVGKVWGI